MRVDVRIYLNFNTHIDIDVFTFKLIYPESRSLEILIFVNKTCLSLDSCVRSLLQDRPKTVWRAEWIPSEGGQGHRDGAQVSPQGHQLWREGETGPHAGTCVCGKYFGLCVDSYICFLRAPGKVMFIRNPTKGNRLKQEGTG
jgi:hypothetical protein